jgi:hypothetical protein
VKGLVSAWLKKQNESSIRFLMQLIEDYFYKGETVETVYLWRMNLYLSGILYSPFHPSYDAPYHMFHLINTHYHGVIFINCKSGLIYSMNYNKYYICSMVQYKVAQNLKQCKAGVTIFTTID